MTLTRIESALRELKNLFVEDPKRLLTSGSAATLVGLDEATMDCLLNALEEVGFVFTFGFGLYRLRSADEGGGFAGS